MKITKDRLESNNKWFERQGRWLGESHLCNILIARIDGGEKITKEILLSLKRQAEVCLKR